MACASNYFNGLPVTVGALVRRLLLTLTFSKHSYLGPYFVGTVGTVGRVGTSDRIGKVRKQCESL